MNTWMHLAKENLKTFLYLFVATFFLIIACNEHKSSIDVEQYKSTGNAAAASAQEELLTHLAVAIADSGFVHAIDYCNLHATELTNRVVDNRFIISVQRLSDKNRNEKNGLTTAEEKAIFTRFTSSLTDTITIAGDFITYYKPIRIMMPTCLNCHGKSDQLDGQVKEILQIKYPGDLAINYSEGDLRGMWKIVMRKQD
jgi:hypothetical protein